jgi:sucrose-6-phosphate hydrolase SacC (GH32 family)
MPFNGMYLLPTELKLKTTKDGIRLTSQPIKETEQLFHLAKRWNNLTSDEANQKMKEFYDADCLRIKTTIKLSHATDAGFNLFGQRMIGYDMNGNTINGVFYSPQDPTSMEISADIYIDRTSIEVFIDGGLYSYSMERRPDPNNQEGFWFWGNRIEIKNIEVYTVDSIWK